MSELYTVDSLEQIFYYLDKSVDISQDEKWHPEVNLLNHLLQCFNIACRESHDIDLVFAALLHDIGKIRESHGHEEIAIELLKDFCSVKTLWLIQHHMRIWHYLYGDMRKLSSCKYLANHPWTLQLIQLCRFDQVGRKQDHKIVYDKKAIIDKLNDIVSTKFEENHNYVNYLKEKGLVWLDITTST